jgi:hypothetical protein
MSERRTPDQRLSTDEPDGTSAFAASLRPPGESIRSAPADPESPAARGEAAEAPDEGDGTGSTALPDDSRAGYDVDAVSGDTDAVRPQ